MNLRAFILALLLYSTSKNELTVEELRRRLSEVLTNLELAGKDVDSYLRELSTLRLLSIVKQSNDKILIDREKLEETIKYALKTCSKNDKMFSIVRRILHVEDKDDLSRHRLAFKLVPCSRRFLLAVSCRDDITEERILVLLKKFADGAARLLDLFANVDLFEVRIYQTNNHLLIIIPELTDLVIELPDRSATEETLKNMLRHVVELEYGRPCKIIIL